MRGTGAPGHNSGRGGRILPARSTSVESFSHTERDHTDVIPKSPGSVDNSCIIPPTVPVPEASSFASAFVHETSSRRTLTRVNSGSRTADRQLIPVVPNIVCVGEQNPSAAGARLPPVRCPHLSLASVPPCESKTSCTEPFVRGYAIAINVGEERSEIAPAIGTNTENNSKRDIHGMRLAYCTTMAAPQQTTRTKHCRQKKRGSPRPASPKGVPPKQPQPILPTGSASFCQSPMSPRPMPAEARPELQLRELN